MSTDATQAAHALPSPRAIAAWVLAVVLPLFVLPLILDAPLLDPDEGLHAAIAQEMVDRGDYVTPRFLGEPFPDKPVLFFWALAAAIRFFGPYEAAVRAVGLGFGLLGALTTLLLGRALFGRTEGWLAGAFYATLLLPLAVAQAAVHDIALVPWINLALLAFWHACRARTDRGLFGHAAFAGMWLGLAILTKGMVGVALVGIAVGGWTLLSGRLRPRTIGAGLFALVVAVLIATPWYLAMERASPGYLHYFAVERHLFGFATDTQRHGQRPWWYYLPILLGGGMPWILFGPLALAGPSRPDGSRRDGIRLVVVWLVGGVAFLSLAGSKLVTYVLPLFPAIALLAAAAWARWLTSVDGRLRRGAWVMLAAQCAAMAVLFAAVPAIVQRRFGVSYHDAVRLAAAVAGLLWVAVALACRRRSASVALAAMLGTMCATAVVAVAALLPPVARTLSGRELAIALNGRPRFPRQLWVVDDRVGSLVFYLSPRLRAGLTSDRIRTVGIDVLLGMRQPPTDVLIAVQERHVARLSRAVDMSRVPFQPAGNYRLYTAAAWQRALPGGPGFVPGTRSADQ